MKRHSQPGRVIDEIGGCGRNRGGAPYGRTTNGKGLGPRHACGKFDECYCHATPPMLVIWSGAAFVAKVGGLANRPVTVSGASDA